jgi:hypothetical protein
MWSLQVSPLNSVKLSFKERRNHLRFLMFVKADWLGPKDSGLLKALIWKAVTIISQIKPPVGRVPAQAPPQTNKQNTL